MIWKNKNILCDYFDGFYGISRVEPKKTSISKKIINNEEKCLSLKIESQKLKNNDNFDQWCFDMTDSLLI